MVRMLAYLCLSMLLIDVLQLYHMQKCPNQNSSSTFQPTSPNHDECDVSLAGVALELCHPSQMRQRTAPQLRVWSSRLCKQLVSFKRNFHKTLSRKARSVIGFLVMRLLCRRYLCARSLIHEILRMLPRLKSLKESLQGMLNMIFGVRTVY